MSYYSFHMLLISRGGSWITCAIRFFILQGQEFYCGASDLTAIALLDFRLSKIYWVVKSKLKTFFSPFTYKTI